MKHTTAQTRPRRRIPVSCRPSWAILLASALAACGGHRPAEESASPPPQPVAVEPSAAPPAPVPTAPAAAEPAPVATPETAEPTTPAGDQPTENASDKAARPKTATSAPRAPAPAVEATSATPPTTAPAPPADPAAATPPTAALVAGPCGEKGQPSCPMQGWMEKNLQSAVDAEDVAKLARGLKQVGALVPDPSWNAGDNGWATIAKTGAAAAEAGDFAGARASCKACHGAWRRKYKADYRLRALP